MSPSPLAQLAQSDLLPSATVLGVLIATISYVGGVLDINAAIVMLASSAVVAVAGIYVEDDGDPAFEG